MEGKKSTVVLLVSVLAIIGMIGFIYALVSGDDSRETQCYYCGKTEKCYSYDLQYVDGYNRDGSIKFGHKIVRMSDSCADKARNSGKYTTVSKH